VIGLDHVGFAVADLDRSIDFYRKLLEREPAARRLYRERYVAEVLGYEEIEIDTAFFELPGGTVFELLEYRTPAGRWVDMETANPGNAHICLVVEDLEREFDRLAQAGVAFRSERPVEIPVGPYKGGRSVYFRDPDGISIQLLEPPPHGASFAA
jgi:catechol 2,3-dioxygenase-like lactoylglutathione lyase family enzyme